MDHVFFFRKNQIRVWKYKDLSKFSGVTKQTILLSWKNASSCPKIANGNATQIIIESKYVIPKQALKIKLNKQSRKNPVEKRSQKVILD